MSVIFRDREFYSTDLDLLGKLEELDHQLKCSDKSVELIVPGSCNGLLCITNLDNDIVLWNMSTRKYHLLPDIPVCSHGYVDYTYGFAYDSMNDDYKVLRMAKHRRDLFCGELEVKVYSLRTNAWRSWIQSIDTSIWFIGDRMGIHYNGALHWIVWEYLPPISILLIAYDVALEAFRKVPLPLPTDDIDSKSLGVLGGCLCVAKSYLGVCVEIWVMKVYGLKDSWTKLFSFTLEEGFLPKSFLSPISYSKNGDKVLFKQIYCGTILYWYDPRNKRVEQFSMPGFRRYYDTIVCSGSLVPLNAH